jgi:hypothetical protein
VTVAADAVQALEPELERDEEPRQEHLSALQASLLRACAESLRQSRRTPLLLHAASTRATRGSSAERRSGVDRRLAPDRRHRLPGSPSEKINLRLYGERRTLIVDRRSGLDRRRDRRETG